MGDCGYMSPFLGESEKGVERESETWNVDIAPHGCGLCGYMSAFLPRVRVY